MLQQVQDALLPVVQAINAYLSDYILVGLLIAVGLWFSIKTRFVQIRCFGEGMGKVFGNLSLFGGKQQSGMSSFQALATAIAAQVGTGNIVGASGAILTGGPGAIFWMWIIAFFGMATIYAEATLAIKTRQADEDGSYHGGPVYYITTAFQGGFGKFLAGFFAVAIILALGFFGCMVQSNSIGSTFQTAFGVQYQNIPVEIDEATLKQIASTTGGQYFRATDNASLKEIYSEIDQMEKTKISVQEYSKKQEEYKNWALLVFALLLVEILLRNTLLRNIP